MISYSLTCGNGHSFEGWFSSSADFDKQKERDLVECPACGDHKVEKALMAPSVATSRAGETAGLGMAAGAEQAAMMKQVRDLARQVRDNAENVGDKFAEEARKIHYGETEKRGIYGRASKEEAKGLAEEGVPFMPLPDLPEDHN